MLDDEGLTDNVEVVPDDERGALEDMGLDDDVGLVLDDDGIELTAD